MKQRQLTQEEIDLTPEWATHYFVDNVDDVCFESGSCYQYLIKGKLLAKCDQSEFGMEEDSQPIPRKAFDISEHEFSDSDISDVRVSGVVCITGGYDKPVTLTLNKADSIVLAKALGVTAEDL